ARKVAGGLPTPRRRLPPGPAALGRRSSSRPLPVCARTGGNGRRNSGAYCSEDVEYEPVARGRKAVVRSGPLSAGAGTARKSLAAAAWILRCRNVSRTGALHARAIQAERERLERYADRW